MKWQLRSLRGIIMQWCIMGNYAAIMSHLTTSSIYETLAWVALLWKLLSCRRSKQHSQEMRGCDKISDDFTTSFSWFSVNSQALITQPFLMQSHENVCKIFCQHFFLEFHLKRWKCFLKIILRKSENNVKIETLFSLATSNHF